MIDAKTLALVATAGLSLGACAPSTEDTMVPPTSNLTTPDDTEPVASETKTFDLNDDGTATPLEVAGGVVMVGAVVAVCPFCILGM